MRKQESEFTKKKEPALFARTRKMSSLKINKKDFVFWSRGNFGDTDNETRNEGLSGMMASIIKVVMVCFVLMTQAGFVQTAGAQVVFENLIGTVPYYSPPIAPPGE